MKKLFFSVKYNNFKLLSFLFSMNQLLYISLETRPRGILVDWVRYRCDGNG